MHRRSSRAAAIAILLPLLATPVWAGFDEANAAYKRGDYETALRVLRPLVNQGDARAQYNLGIMYHKGHGLPQDYAEAVKWYRKAANQGNAMAQYNLGLMYDKGEGVPQDYVEAVEWYRKPAKQGYAPAQYNLGVMFFRGEGVPQDYVRAYMWISLAASRFPPGADRDRAINSLDDLAKGMPPHWIAKAERLAREWKEKHKR